jgi:hypothetical protein
MLQGAPLELAPLVCHGSLTAWLAPARCSADARGSAPQHYAQGYMYGSPLPPVAVSKSRASRLFEGLSAAASRSMAT